MMISTKGLLTLLYFVSLAAALNSSSVESKQRTDSLNLDESDAIEKADKPKNEEEELHNLRANQSKKTHLTIKIIFFDLY